MFKKVSLTILLSLISVTSFGRTLNGSCAHYDARTLLQQALADYQKEIIQALQQEVQIEVVKKSAKINNFNTRLITGREATGEIIKPWTSVEAQASLLLQTAKGTILEVTFTSRHINSALTRALNPYDAWSIKPGFTIGMGNEKSEASDNEGNVRGSAISCEIYLNVETVEVKNRATGLPVLYGTYNGYDGEWRRP